ncbi:MAG: DUF1161 domain-containing protein [Panacagrimonas sp.]
MTMKIRTLVSFALLACAGSAQAAKDCGELKSEIEAKLQAKGVKQYTLDAVPAADAGERKVVGTCDGGKQKIVYSRAS